jgi:hypothetical protein
VSRLAKFADCERGTAPLELVAWAALLLLPLAPAIELQRALSHQLAAESIARNALRTAILAADGDLELLKARAAVVALELARSWDVDTGLLALGLDCSRCESDEIALLQVQLGNQSASAIMGLEPRDAES